MSYKAHTHDKFGIQQKRVFSSLEFGQVTKRRDFQRNVEEQCIINRIMSKVDKNNV